MPFDETRPESAKRAVLHRMAMPGHLCPFGLKSKALLERRGFEIEDHLLTDRAQVDAFMDKHGVKTTPQTFIGGERIGGYSELRAHFGDPLPDADATTYRPVLMIFAVSAALAVGVGWMLGEIVALRTVEIFAALAMTLLGLQKLQDVESFSTMFLNYDLLARRWVRYGYIYPWLETGAGLLMVAGALTWLSAPVALAIGLIGAVSVFKAVYIDRRELKCACVGGGSNVPLGFVSLTENLAMIAMGLWMPLRMLWGL
ncbi:MauE/DoxX family redox-associated membrane protein [uncultured Albimonas sp.]|mgnify:CR=1 FL=1|uniref:MauE/DoxX family redox-associated membrane protein n=1 Tax=uncultured Albimonas sp. TaxID=1331701 RepID=UPI0030EE3BCF|tara:strand:- start:1373 stop:2143 length:771 start_codon:yes stop_codon:yes gene_type:complete